MSPHVLQPGWSRHNSLGADERTHDLAEAARRLHHQGAADGVGITVLLPDDLIYGCANRFTEQVDDTQYDLMEGPCVTAAKSGVLVRSDTIGEHERRWPSFTPRAAALSLRSVVSAPLLRADGTVIGSLNLYARAEQGLSVVDEDTARRLAAHVEPLARNTRLLAVASRNSQLLRAAKQDGDEIKEALERLVPYYALSTSHARILLTQLARQNGSTELEAAREVVTRLEEHQRG